MPCEDKILTVHAIKNRVLHMWRNFVFSVFVFLYGCGLHSKMDFYVENAWVDNENVYIEFYKQTGTYYYTLLNINGDLIGKEKIKYFRYIIPKRSINPSIAVNLDEEKDVVEIASLSNNENIKDIIFFKKINGVLGDLKAINEKTAETYFIIHDTKSISPKVTIYKGYRMR